MGLNQGHLVSRDEAGMQTLVPPIPMLMLKIIAIPWEEK